MDILALGGKVPTGCVRGYLKVRMETPSLEKPSDTEGYYRDLLNDPTNLQGFKVTAQEKQKYLGAGIEPAKRVLPKTMKALEKMMEGV